MRISVLTAITLIISSVAVADPLPVDLEKVDFEPARFHLTVKGETLGEMYYAIERRGDEIIIHDATTMLPGTRESGTLVIDAKTLEPKSIVVDGDFERTIFDAELVFADGKASGAYRIKRPNETAKTDRPFEMELTEGTIARASIFGLVTGLPLEIGASFKFKWFNTLAGGVADAEIAVTTIETIEVPAGSFETYVAMLNAQPENILYITTQSPHKVVRIDVVGQEMKFERLP